MFEDTIDAVAERIEEVYPLPMDLLVVVDGPEIHFIAGVIDPQEAAEYEVEGWLTIAEITGVKDVNKLAAVVLYRMMGASDAADTD